MIFCKLRVIILIESICRLISAIDKSTLSKRCLCALVPVVFVSWIRGPPVLEMEVIFDLYLVVGALTRLILFLIEAHSTLLKANWGLEALWWADRILVESVRWLVIRRAIILDSLGLQQILAHHRENVAHVAAICSVASIAQWRQTFGESVVILRLGLILHVYWFLYFRCVVLWWLLDLRLLEVLVEDDEIIILLNVVPQVIILLQKRPEFERWSVVSEFTGLNALTLKHELEHLMAMPSPLHRFMHVEIQDRHRHHLNEFALLISAEQLLGAYFEDAQALILVKFNIQFVARTIKFRVTCYWVWQLLGLLRNCEIKLRYFQNILIYIPSVTLVRVHRWPSSLGSFAATYNSFSGRCR